MGRQTMEMEFSTSEQKTDRGSREEGTEPPKYSDSPKSSPCSDVPSPTLAAIEAERQSERERKIRAGKLRVGLFAAHCTRKTELLPEPNWLEPMHWGTVYVREGDPIPSRFNRLLNEEEKALHVEELAYIHVVTILGKMRFGARTKSERKRKENAVRALIIGVHRRGVDPERLPRSKGWDDIWELLDCCPVQHLENVYLMCGAQK